MKELPEDDVPEKLLTVIRQEKDDEITEKEMESYLLAEVEEIDDEVIVGSSEMMVESEDDGKEWERKQNLMTRNIDFFKNLF